MVQEPLQVEQMSATADHAFNSDYYQWTYKIHTVWLFSPQVLLTNTRSMGFSAGSSHMCCGLQMPVTSTGSPQL